MKTAQFIWEEGSGWDSYGPEKEIVPQLVIFFGEVSLLASSERYSEMKQMFPEASIVGCSTAGEIMGDEVLDNSIVLTAVEFEKTPIETTSISISSMENSYTAGIKLAQGIEPKDLKAVFVISDGQHVNGSELVVGLREVLGDEMIITGGLAGDGGKFEKTLVSCNGNPESGQVAIVGFYGDAIQIGHGSQGGWDTFGPERKITRSESNVLMELDGRPALELYKEYLGEQAEQLPGSALLFPLMIRPTDQTEKGIVRTVLSIKEEDQSMTFAGNITEGYSAQLMMANFDQLIGGAAEAAKFASTSQDSEGRDTLAILISCVGRKMVLGQRIGDEVESVMETLGENTKQIGFYSYGEISPHVEMGNCELHNQTMTITTFSEIV